MKIEATFLGKDGSLGFKRGATYRLELERSTIVTPVRCPYSGVESFLANWQVTRVGWQDAP